MNNLEYETFEHTGLLKVMFMEDTDIKEALKRCDDAYMSWHGMEGDEEEYAMPMPEFIVEKLTESGCKVKEWDFEEYD